MADSSSRGVDRAGGGSALFGGLGWRDVLALLLVVVAVDPGEAMAWGPVTHVAIGQSVLGSLSVLPGAIAALLARHRISYLYGCIAADVVFAKRLSRVKQFCHHWSTAWRLLDSSESDRDRAFSYGYLSHLAADTVAHGKFVPRQVTLSGTSVNFGHFFWELRADNALGDRHQDDLRAVLDADHGDHHRSMAVHLTDTFLPYAVNRRLFDRMNAMAARRTFQGRVDRLCRGFRGHLSPRLLAGYYGECVDRTLSMLTEGKASALMREDPNGTSALMRLSVQQRDLRKMRRRGVPIYRHVREVSRSLSPPALPAPATV